MIYKIQVELHDSWYLEVSHKLVYRHLTTRSGHGTLIIVKTPLCEAKYIQSMAMKNWKIAQGDRLLWVWSTACKITVWQWTICSELH